MRVLAKHGIFYRGAFFRNGEAFDADDNDCEMLSGMVTVIVPPQPKPAEEVEPKKPANRRSTKTAKN